MHHRAGAQSRHCPLHAPSEAGRDALRAYAWRSSASAVLRLAAEIDSAAGPRILCRAQQLRRVSHLHQSRTRHVLVARPDQLPSRGLAISSDTAGRLHRTGGQAEACTTHSSPPSRLILSSCSISPSSAERWSLPSAAFTQMLVFGAAESP